MTDRADLRRLARAHWVWAFAAFSLLNTVGWASAVLVRRNQDAGAALDWTSALAWQGLVWGSWLPVAWVIGVLVRKLGLGSRLMAALYALFWAAVPLHAGLAAALDVAFSPRLAPADWLRVAGGRVPVDMLIFMALGGFVVAMRAQRRAAEEARRAAALEEALEAARSRLAQRRPQTEEGDTRLMVSAGSRRVVVEVGEVEWFASAGNYVVVNWNGREGLVRETLQALEKRLDPAVFARSHRSTIANMAKVRETASLSDGSWRLVMETGAELVASRTYRDEILRRLGRA
ncbi:MAG TPA: LytTR family DNA-binding domain-containing protein [Caulobacteraceae bacterium]